MEKYENPRGVAGAGGDSEALLAEFRSWLRRERGLAPESARCYANQAKTFLAAVGDPRALAGLGAGQVTSFHGGLARDRNSWTAKASCAGRRPPGCSWRTSTGAPGR